VSSNNVARIGHSHDPTPLVPEFNPAAEAALHRQPSAPRFDPGLGRSESGVLHAFERGGPAGPRQRRKLASVQHDPSLGSSRAAVRGRRVHPLSGPQRPAVPVPWGESRFTEGIEARLTAGPLAHDELTDLREFLTRPPRSKRECQPGRDLAAAAEESDASTTVSRCVPDDVEGGCGLSDRVLGRSIEQLIVVIRFSLPGTCRPRSLRLL